MFKILKDYGAVAEHGSKTLNLQKVNVDNKICIALVSYRDGMRINVMDITDEVEILKELLEDYLDYKPPITEPNVVKSLITLPAGDCNYQTVLKKATEEELKEAINTMKNNGGRNATRIKACETQLKKVGKVEKSEPKETAKPKQTAKVIQFPTEDKRPKVIKLITQGDNTYDDCVEKMTKEKETFTDPDSQYVIEGLLELAKVDTDFCNNLMREDKSYGGFMEYMYEAAKKGYCIKFGNVGWIDRDVALGLAIDYYNHDEEKQKAQEKAEAEKRKAEAEAKKKKGAKSNGNVRKKKSRTK